MIPWGSQNHFTLAGAEGFADSLPSPGGRGVLHHFSVKWLWWGSQGHFTLAEHQSKIDRNTLSSTLTASYALHETGQSP